MKRMDVADAYGGRHGNAPAGTGCAAGDRPGPRRLRRWQRWGRSGQGRPAGHHGPRRGAERDRRAGGRRSRGRFVRRWQSGRPGPTRKRHSVGRLGDRFRLRVGRVCVRRGRSARLTGCGPGRIAARKRRWDAVPEPAGRVGWHQQLGRSHGHGSRRRRLRLPTAEHRRHAGGVRGPAPGAGGHRPPRPPPAPGPDRLLTRTGATCGVRRAGAGRRRPPPPPTRRRGRREGPGRSCEGGTWGCSPPVRTPAPTGRRTGRRAR